MPAYKSHPAMFRNRPFAFLAGVLLILVGVVALIGASKEPGGGLRGLAILALTTLPMIVWWIRTLGTTLTVDDERVTLRRGLLSKHTTDVMLTDVRNVSVSQGVLNRVFNVGAIGIASSGHGGVEIQVAGIPSPGKVKSLIDAARRQSRG